MKDENEPLYREAVRDVIDNVPIGVANENITYVPYCCWVPLTSDYFQDKPNLNQH